MKFLEKEIQEYTQLVCSTILGIEAQPLAENYEASSDTFKGSVQITGKWNGALLLCLPSSLVNKLTETLFSLEPGKASAEDKKDAVGELINMIGGNLKALLPEPCTLSVPLLGIEGQDLYFPYTKRVTHCLFECQGKPFSLSLYEEIETSKKDSK